MKCMNKEKIKQTFFKVIEGYGYNNFFLNKK